MAGVTSESTPINQTSPSNLTQVPDTQQYSDAELVLIGAAMAVLVLAIVFGKYCKRPASRDKSAVC